MINLKNRLFVILMMTPYGGIRVPGITWMQQDACREQLRTLRREQPHLKFYMALAGPRDKERVDRWPDRMRSPFCRKKRGA